MTVGQVDTEEITATRAARAWYAKHRSDVLARLADPARSPAAGVRSAQLLAFALDDDPGVVARTRAMRQP